MSRAEITNRREAMVRLKWARLTRPRDCAIMAAIGRDGLAERTDGLPPDCSNVEWRISEKGAREACPELFWEADAYAKIAARHAAREAKAA